jgi:uncharacterized membrane protein YhiD involved in acid resistance
MMAASSMLDDFPAFDRLLESLGGTNGESLRLDEVLLRLGLACVIGWLIGYVFRHTYTGRKYTPSLPDTHMLLCLAGAMIWVVVQNSVARAFGLAGTVGMIRYRTIVRDPKDTTLLLFSMILGMSCGLGQYPVAIVGTFVIIFTLLWLHLHNRRQQIAEARKNSGLLDLMSDTDDELMDDNDRPPAAPKS